MTGKFYRKTACLAAMLGLSVASSPATRIAAASPTVATVAHSMAAPAEAATSPAAVRARTGAGWGSMIGCAACAVAAGVIIAGGPGAVIAAVNAPGSAIALLACGATCYEAFQ